MARKDYMFTMSIKKSLLFWISIGSFFAAIVWLANKFHIAQQNYIFPISAFSLLLFTFTSLTAASEKIRSLNNALGLSTKESRRMEGLVDDWDDKIKKWKGAAVFIAVLNLGVTVISFSGLSFRYILFSYFAFGFILGMSVTIYFVSNRIKSETDSFVLKKRLEKELEDRKKEHKEKFGD